MNINNINIQDEHQPLRQQQQQPRKRCHGNRKDQRFRKKCRARGMKPKKIEKLLNKRKKNNKKNNRISDYIRRMMNDKRTIKVPNKTSNQTSEQLKQKVTMVTKNLNKRKRDVSLQELKTISTIPKSTSSISILQPLSKKPKNQKRKQ